MLRLLPIFFTAITLGGCSAARVQQPVAMPFTGTWHQIPKENNRDPSGFLAIDHHRLLFNLDGFPRGTMTIADNDTDAGLRSGRLIGDDGRVLYVAVGETITEQQAGNQRVYTATLHLDVHWFALGAGPTDKPIAVMRLWPSTALASLAIHPTMTNPAATATTPELPIQTLSPTNSLTPADRHFVAVVKTTRNGYLNAVVTQIISARSEGENISHLDSLYHRCANVLRSDIVRELDAARLGDTGALLRADQQSNDLMNVDHAFHQWRSQF